ncbi:MAG: TIGR00300 family protein [Halobacteria archaeon]
MTVTHDVELEGHIIDSGIMERCFRIIMEMGGDFNVKEFDIGRHKHEESFALLEVQADTDGELREIIHQLHQSGANPSDPEDAALEPAPDDKVVPKGFYSTTNHPTHIMVDGEWIEVDDIEMDCAVVVEPEEKRAYTKTLNSIEEGDLIVTGEMGIWVKPPERSRDTSGTFGFMEGGVSSERPTPSLISKIADAVEKTKEEGGEILVVAGPALIHSGARDDLARLVRGGYVDMMSIGNGFAVHDIEHDLYGTSLGVDTENLENPRKGHKHHIYAISEVIRAGGIEEAVEDGLIKEGIMYEAVKNEVPYVIAGSIRDDGPLPDTVTDMIEAQNQIREQAHQADLVLMMSTLLHSVAVGNCLPSTTRTVCVDINPGTVTQLVDRGSAQAIGLVTDIGSFVPLLAEEVLEEE